MRARFTLIFLLLLGLGSCRDSVPPHSIPARGDSIVSAYLRQAESSGLYDTSIESFQLLKAAYRGDTAVLKWFQEEMQMQAELDKATKEAVRNSDSSVPLKPLYQFNVDEAYRFSYAAAFCPDQVVLTVSRSHDSILLQTLMYKERERSGYMHGQLIRSSERTLSVSEWDKLLEELDYCDFWGLNCRNDKAGFDGSSLTITGYNARSRRLHQPGKGPKSLAIYRWSPEHTAVFRPFKRVMKYAGIKQCCRVLF